MVKVALITAIVFSACSCASVINNLNGDIDEVGLAKEVMDSVVYIHVTAMDGNYSGSGIIFNPNGYILTNYHVVDGAISISVDTHDHSTYIAKVVDGSDYYDLAILKIETYKDLKCVKLGNSDEVQVGETVYAAGNPLQFNWSFSKGVVSGVNRNLAGYSGLIQTDVSINPGSSGGALLNKRGEVIGITSMAMKAVGNMTFAQPINNAKVFIKANKIDIPMLQTYSVRRFNTNSTNWDTSCCDNLFP